MPVGLVDGYVLQRTVDGGRGHRQPCGLGQCLGRAADVLESGLAHQQSVESLLGCVRYRLAVLLGQCYRILQGHGERRVQWAGVHHLEQSAPVAENRAYGGQRDEGVLEVVHAELGCEMHLCRGGAADRVDQ